MSSLSSHERVQFSLAHQEPDKVPIDLGGGRQTSIYLEPYLKTGERLGLSQLEVALSPRDVVDRFDERFLKSCLCQTICHKAFLRKEETHDGTKEDDPPGT